MILVAITCLDSAWGECVFLNSEPLASGGCVLGPLKSLSISLSRDLFHGETESDSVLFYLWHFMVVWTACASFDLCWQITLPYLYTVSCDTRLWKWQQKFAVSNLRLLQKFACCCRLELSFSMWVNEWNVSLATKIFIARCSYEAILICGDIVNEYWALVAYCLWVKYNLLTFFHIHIKYTQYEARLTM